jgi:hypothetical protein
LVDRDSDVALILSYTFHDQTVGDEDSNDGSNDEPARKKYKLTTAAKRSVLEFSRIKLPAARFGDYLEQECKQFVSDCLRYIYLLIWYGCPH